MHFQVVVECCEFISIIAITRFPMLLSSERDIRLSNRTKAASVFYKRNGHKLKNICGFWKEVNVKISKSKGAYTDKNSMLATQ